MLKETIVCSMQSAKINKAHNECLQSNYIPPNYLGLLNLSNYVIELLLFLYIIC